MWICQGQPWELSFVQHLRRNHLEVLEKIENSMAEKQKMKEEEENEKPPDMPVTHDSMRLIEQAKTICEQRIYLDEAKELYCLISSKWLHVSTIPYTKTPHH